MPQAIIRYNPEVVSAEFLQKIASDVCRIVAETVSTDSCPLTSKDVDWLPQANESGAIAEKISIELRTIGFPDRKEKLNREAVIRLKGKLLGAGFYQHMDDDRPLIWVQFIDPDGVHV